MIRLHTFIDCLPGTPDPSGFVVKLMTVLRLAGVGHERVEVGNPAIGPKGKVPFITEGNVTLGDTALILAYLKETRGIDLDRHLTPIQMAQSHALQRMLEERLYWAIVYSRWMEPANAHIENEIFFADIPWPIRGFIARKAHKSVEAALHHHGLGRHTREEIYGFGTADIHALSEILGNNAFLFGSEPSVADATAFGMLINIAGPDIPSPLKDAVNADPRLVAYVHRMQLLFNNAAPRDIRQAA
ncbi:MAG: glutathione S-transferase [Rhodobiaceae bacterium]|nr:MAG: glutathione S-transferase [Rhodobiaceae bacterium]